MSEVTRDMLETWRKQIRGIIADWSANDETSDYHTKKLDAVFTIALERLDMEEALTPSAATKAAYIGEFRFSQEISDHEGGSYTQSYTVPWTTTKEIMAAILARALPKPKGE